MNTGRRPAAPGEDQSRDARARRYAVGLLAVLVAGAAAYAYVFVHRFIFYTDNQAYLLLGRSLAEGLGYVDVWAGDGRPHIHFSPGYPVIIALASKLAISSIFALKLLNGAFVLASVGLLYGWARRVLADRSTALVACAFVALNASVLRFGSLLMSEAPFIFMTTLALYALARSEERSRRQALWFGLLLLAVPAAVYVRTVGVGLVLGIGAELLVGRRWRRAAVAAAVWAAALLPWWWRGRTIGGGYSHHFFGWQQEPGGSALRALVERIGENIAGYLKISVPEALMPGLVPASDLIPGLGIVASSLVLGLAAWGVACLPRHRIAVGLYLLATAGVLVLWPTFWNTYRFVVPVVPLLSVAAVWGGLQLGGRLLQAGRPAPVWVVLPFLLFTLPGLFEGRNWARHGDSTLALRLEKATGWIQEIGPPDAKPTGTTTPEVFYYLSGRPAVRMRGGATPAETLAYLDEDGLGYVLVTAAGAQQQMYSMVVPMIDAFPERFELLRFIERPEDRRVNGYPYYTALYRVLPADGRGARPDSTGAP